jgi:cytochrome c
MQVILTYDEWIDLKEGVDTRQRVNEKLDAAKAEVILRAERIAKCLGVWDTTLSPVAQELKALVGYIEGLKIK